MEIRRVAGSARDRPLTRAGSSNRKGMSGLDEDVEQMASRYCGN